MPISLWNTHTHSTRHFRMLFSLRIQAWTWILCPAEFGLCDVRWGLGTDGFLVVPEAGVRWCKTLCTQRALPGCSLCCTSLIWTDFVSCWAERFILESCSAGPARIVVVDCAFDPDGLPDFTLLCPCKDLSGVDPPARSYWCSLRRCPAIPYMKHLYLVCSPIQSVRPNTYIVNWKRLWLL